MNRIDDNAFLRALQAPCRSRASTHNSYKRRQHSSSSYDSHYESPKTARISYSPDAAAPASSLTAPPASDDGFDDLLREYTTANPAQVEAAVRAVNADLFAQLRRNGLTVFPYGSMVTKLNIKDSDCDYFATCLYMNHNQHRNVLRDIDRLLRRSGRFEQLFYVRKARVPIVKCIHKATGLHVDINATSWTSLYNTALVAAVVRSDARLRRYLLLVKIWGKQAGIVAQHQFSSHGLVMLALFYLQQPEGGGVLPPLLTLFSHTDVPYDRYGAPDYEFPVWRDALHLPPQFSVWEALRGFFRYYASLDVSNAMLCPYTGLLLNRTFDLDESALWLVERNLDGSVSHNVAKQLSASGLSMMVYAMNAAHQLASLADGQRPPVDVFRSILESRLPTKAVAITKEVKISASVLTQKLTPGRQDLTRLADYLKANDGAHYNTHTVWINHTMQTVLHILREVMMARLTPLNAADVDSNYKPLPPGTATLQQPAANRVEEYLMAINWDVWSGRLYGAATASKDEQLTRLDAQRKQSLQMIAVAARSLHNTYALLTARLEHDPTSIELEMRLSDATGKARPAEPITKKHVVRKFFNALSTIFTFYSLKEELDKEQLRYQLQDAHTQTRN